jgi:diguanylate cyclase (GGDEF)-like protein
VAVRSRIPFTTNDRLYLGVRVVMIALLVVMVAFDSIDIPQDSTARLALIIGMILISLAGILTLAARISGRRDADRVLWEVLPLDLLGAGLLIWATGNQQDPFYPWMLGLAIAYSVVTRKRRAWTVAGLAAATYLIGHGEGPGMAHTTAQYVFLVFKTVGLVLTGYLVADATQRQSERESRLQKSQEDVGELNEQLSRRLAELHAISEITEVIHSTLDFERVGPLVLDILSKVIDLPSSCLFVIDKDKDETLFSASAGLNAAAVKSYSDRWNASGISTGGSGDDLFACTTVLDHKRMMVVFCAAGDRIERMSPEDRLVLQAVASELVVAVENSQLYKLTKRLSITDELTGLFNYRYLQQRLDDEIERARRYSRSLSLLMLDADDFKKFNDTHGHIAGDRALAELAQVLRTAVREIDVVCRYGGEEFSVVLPETDAEGAFVVAEKVREAVAAHSFADANGVRGVRVTVSIGLATFPATAADQEELLRQADDALYTAKNTGRDRVRAPGGSRIVIAPLREAASEPEESAS